MHGLFHVKQHMLKALFVVNENKLLVTVVLCYNWSVKRCNFVRVWNMFEMYFPDYAFVMEKPSAYTWTYYYFPLIIGDLFKINHNYRWQIFTTFRSFSLALDNSSCLNIQLTTFYIIYTDYRIIFSLYQLKETSEFTLCVSSSARFLFASQRHQLKVTSFGIMIQKKGAQE